MRFLIDTDNLHHAYLIEGNGADTRTNLFEFIEKKLKHPVQANPDFWHEQFETLGIDDARRLRDMQSRTALSNGKKIFVIEVFFITHEAQNALLKVFEEPSQNTHFFMIIPTQELLLPTVRSRMFIISEESTGLSENYTEIEKYVLSSIPERLQYVSGIIEEKDKQKAIHFIDTLIKYLYSQKNKKSGILEELLRMRGYMNDRSPSIKLILEHISLIL